MMGQVSQYLRKAVGGYSHFCPACDAMHYINTDAPNEKGHKWTFDGDLYFPTFRPSINISSPPVGDIPATRCHYTLTKGKLNFVNDCTHSLKGKTVPIPPLPRQYCD